jgi:two-component system OmpR family sensor kinase
MLYAYSLHRRLGGSLLCVVLLAGLIGALSSFLIIRDLATEFGHPLAPLSIASHANHAQDLAAPRPADGKDLIVQIWKDGNKARPNITSSAVTVLPRAAAGLTTIGAAGLQWDVLALPVGQDFVEIAQLRSTRGRDTSQWVLWYVAPGVALLAMLIVAIAFVVRRCLRPLERLGHHVAALDPAHPQPLAPIDAPSEITPFIESFNRAMEMLSTSRQAERQFIANAAHALRTPIAAIQLQAANLLEAPAAQREERLDELRRGISRMASLGSQLMGLAHADAGHTGKTQAELLLPPVVCQVVSELLPLATQRDVDLGANVLQPLAVRAAEDDVRTILKNIVDNAIRYCQAGASVDIDIHRAGDSAVIEVLDNGPGIAAVDLPRIFGRFQRGQATLEPGNGLGLSIARTVAENYGGRVILANRSDGATGVLAHIELPLCAAQPVQA